MTRCLLITGAAGGIGGALVKRALDRGERVTDTVLSSAEAQSLAPHPNLRVLVMDVGSTASVTAAFAEIDAFLGGATLDVVISTVPRPPRPARTASSAPRSRKSPRRATASAARPRLWRRSRGCCRIVRSTACSARC